MNKAQFKHKIGKIQTATSKKGKEYFNIKVENDYCVGEGYNRKKPFKIKIDKLYEAYCKLNITPTNLKCFVNGNQSPAYAILKEAGLICEEY